MPGFDRSGPMGAGSLTGAGRGHCNPASTGSRLPLAAGLGRGMAHRRGFRGGGHGRGLGMGRARGRGFGFYPHKADRTASMESVDEMQVLKTEAEYLQKTLAAINRRIESLEEEFVDTVD